MSGKRVLIWTDGSASVKDRSGGYAAILRYGDNELPIAGYAHDTTNQRMEMHAVIAALAKLNTKRRWKVTVYSDSAYVVNCFNEGWIAKWRTRGWRTSKNKPVDNRDMWETMEALVALFDVEFKHVKGHSGHAMNDRVDEMAHDARMQGKEIRAAAA